MSSEQIYINILKNFIFDFENSLMCHPDMSLVTSNDIGALEQQIRNILDILTNTGKRDLFFYKAGVSLFEEISHIIYKGSNNELNVCSSSFARFEALIGVDK